MNFKDSPIIKNGFVDTYGKKFEIKSTVFDPQNYGFLEFITETERDETKSWSYDENYDTGIYLYRSLVDKKQGYRIYRAYQTYKFNSFFDAKMIEELQKRQKNIRKTEFPTGVITLNDGRVIGQLVPFYDKSPTIYKYSIDPKNKGKNPFKLYIDVLKSLSEMSNEGITYYDNHSNNFVIVNEEKGIIKTIDFDHQLIEFDSIINQPIIFYKFLNMVNGCNENLQILDKTGMFKNVNNYSDAESQLLEMNDKFSR